MLKYILKFVFVLFKKKIFMIVIIIYIIFVFLFMYEVSKYLRKNILFIDMVFIIR